MRPTIFLIIFLFLLFVPSAIAIEFPSQIGRVNDFADILDSDEEKRLDNAIRAIENNSMVEIVIVTNKSVQGMSAGEFGYRLLKKWGIGKKSNQHGLLILVVTSDEVYYRSNKGIFTDAQLSKIGNDILMPNIESGETGKGLYEAVQEITNIVEENPHIFALPDPELIKYEINVNNIHHTYYFSKDARNLVLLSIFIGLIIFVILFVKIKYLFNWDEIPGNDNILLIDYLKKKFNIDWVTTAKIEKNYYKSIKVSNGSNSLLLHLNEENTKVKLIINNVLMTNELFIAKAINGELNIYKKYTKQAQTFLIGYGAILLIVTYIKSIGLYWYIVPKFFVLILIIIFYKTYGGRFN